MPLMGARLAPDKRRNSFIRKEKRPAWPGVSRSGGRSGRPNLASGVLLAETIDAATRVDDFLLARVERVAR